MNSHKIKVMIADDHEMFREMLAKELLENDIDVIGQADNGQTLIDLINETQPDIILLDLRMPILDGHEVLKILAKDFPNIRTIVISNDYTDYYVANVIINGAYAYIKKSSKVSEVLDAIHSVHKDGYYFNDVISKKIIKELNSDKKIYYLIQDKKFSEREIEVIQELCKDITAGQVAANLNITENTVQYHKNNIKKKTDSETIISLVRYAIRQGIITNP